MGGGKFAISIQLGFMRGFEHGFSVMENYRMEFRGSLMAFAFAFAWSLHGFMTRYLDDRWL